MTPKIIWLLALAMLGAGCSTQASRTTCGVRALQYRIKVSQSGFHMSHGAFEIVDELFLPDHGVACNIEWTLTAAFERVPQRLRAFPATSARLEDAGVPSEVLLPFGLAMSIVALASQPDALARQVMDLGLLLSEPSSADSTTQGAGADGASRLGSAP